MDSNEKVLNLKQNYENILGFEEKKMQDMAINYCFISQRAHKNQAISIGIF